jgi:hypothetical protein
MKNDLLRKVVRALIKEEYTQVSPGASDALGKVAFSKFRLDDVPNDEEDTPEEAELYRAFHKYVTKNKGDEVTPEMVAQILGMLKSRNYQKVFKEPEADIVYRGMCVGREWLASALSVDKKDLEENGEVEMRMTFVPRTGNGLSSWSTDEDAANDFAEDVFSQYAGEYGVMIYATPAANKNKFLDLNDGLYKVKPLDELAHEQECLGFGDILAFKIRWWKLRRPW